MSDLIRTLAAQVAAHESWAHTSDPTARTANARAALMARFEREVDPHGLLTDEERTKRAAHARTAYYTRLALRSAVARRNAARATAVADAADAEMKETL
jgi:hypothetical protein